MLRIYFEDDNLEEIRDSIIGDVEKAFEEVELKGTEKEKQLIKYIEQGEYKDNMSYIDRFGNKLYLSELSTGCKAALCVLDLQNKVVSLKECGLNARDIIISICDRGSVMLTDNCITYSDYADMINVRVDNYIFHTVDRLNRYICDERPYEISYGWDGVECVSE